jgi:hypothetical protein
MKIKPNFLYIFLVVVLLAGFLGFNNANAQTSTSVNPFPEGCSSALGYSVTTGHPCNGTSTVTTGPLPGCSTALGYSVTNGVPCSGSSVALSYLAGCSSIYGYSTFTGRPCNGTSVAATVAVNNPTGGTTIPGLPTTGDGGNALKNVLLLTVSGLIAVSGFWYSSRKKSSVA